MAKKRIINRGYRPIKNAHLIGKGGKHVKPVRGSWVKGYNKAFKKSGVKPKTVRNPLKSKASYIPKKTHSFSKKIRTVKASPVRIKGLNKMKAKMAKTPSKQMTMQKRKLIKRKPPTKGRER